jgi:hypothetical protein
MPTNVSGNKITKSKTWHVWKGLWTWSESSRFQMIHDEEYNQITTFIHEYDHFMTVGEHDFWKVLAMPHFMLCEHTSNGLTGGSRHIIWSLLAVYRIPLNPKGKTLFYFWKCWPG